MIYIIHGNEEIFIRRKLGELRKQQDCELIDMDGSDKSFQISEMLENCTGNSLFSSKIAVFVKDPYFLIRKVDEKELKDLFLYIESPLYETDLIFFTYEDLFSSKLKAFKMISENAQVITCNHIDPKNFNAYVSQRLNEEKLSISKDAFFALCAMCKNNATLLNDNIEILKLYPDKIGVEAVLHLCSAEDSHESFDLINAITAKDVSKAVRLSRQMIKEDREVLGMISLLASQLRYLYHVSYLLKKGQNKRQIAENTGSSEGRVGYALKTLSGLSLKKILELEHRLADLDILCKSDDSVSDMSRFEFFILDLLKEGL